MTRSYSTTHSRSSTWPTQVSFDAAAGGWPMATLGLGLLRLCPRSRPAGMTVTIKNGSPFPIADFAIEPLALRFPARPRNPIAAEWIETLPDRLGAVEASFGAGKLLLCCETVGR